MNSRVLKLTTALFLAGALAGCSTVGGTFYTASYSSVTDAGYVVPAIPSEKIQAQYRRQIVKYPTDEAPGTIIVDTREKFLYLIMPEGKAMRYGIGVGRDGFTWKGEEKVTRKAAWPGWTPPPEMIARERKKGRKLPAFMAGGPQNPMGARALYLGNTVYRIHGTNEDWSIGQAVSSGCFRMWNDDVEHLYSEVSVGAKVVIR